MLVRNHGRHEGSPPGRSGPVTATQCGRRFQSTDYISGVSGLDDRAVADGFWGVGGVSGAAGCEAAAGCFFWALVAAALRAAALRMRVFAALRPAARCLRVAAAFLVAALCLRVAAAFFPALFRLGLISSSVTIRKGIKPEVACLCKTCLWTFPCARELRSRAFSTGSQLLRGVSVFGTILPLYGSVATFKCRQVCRRASVVRSQVAKSKRLSMN